MKKEELTKTRQYKQLQKMSSAAVYVPLAWCARFDLSPTELLIYCTIRHHTERFIQHAYTGSIKGLSVISNTTLPTARKAVETLEAKGFIIKGSQARNLNQNLGADWVTYVSTIPSNVPLNDPTIEDKLEPHAAAYTAMKEYRDKQRLERGKLKRK